MIKWKRSKQADIDITVYDAETDSFKFKILNWGLPGATLRVWLKVAIQEKNGDWHYYWQIRKDIRCDNVKAAKEKAETTLEQNMGRRKK